MIKLAFYGKGGIGKSTTVSNLAAAMAERGLRVMQIGCDPKADSTALLRGEAPIPTVLSLVREKKAFTLEDMIKPGYQGVLCVEAGGPLPGTGCAGRGIITALEQLEAMGAYQVYQPDVILYDVLGDVVCGGFSMPMREGYAQKVFILTSGEKMSLYAAANIAVALDRFRDRGYARLGGLILNHRDVEQESQKVQALAEEFGSSVIGELTKSALVLQAEAEGKTVLEAFPDTSMGQEYRLLADTVLRIGGMSC